MRHIDISPGRLTSVTIRASARQRVKVAVEYLNNRGLIFSEQRLMRECLRKALKLWRGHRGIATRNKKYNRRLGPYEIVPFYTSEALRSVAWARCHHSGISLSRLMDWAITCYLQRVIEYWLRFEYRARDREDAEIWRAKHESRRHRVDFLISYEARTAKNDSMTLDYAEKTTIIPWPPPNRLAA